MKNKALLERWGWVCLVAPMLTFTPGLVSAAGTGQPQLELSMGVLGEATRSDYTSTLGHFGYTRDDDYLGVNLGYRASLVWPITEHIGVVVSGEKIERGEYYGFEWDVYGFAGAIRGSLDLGFDGSLYLQAGVGPTWARTTLDRTYVENHMGHHFTLSSGAVLYVAERLGITMSATRYHAWVMTNRLGDEHNTANWNAIMGFVLRLGGGEG